MQTGENCQRSLSRGQIFVFDPRGFARRLQEEGAFSRTQAETVAGQVYAALFRLVPEPVGLESLMAAGFTRQQSEALRECIDDYVNTYYGGTAVAHLNAHFGA